MKLALLFFALCRMSGSQAPAVSYGAGCQYYYNESLKEKVYTTVEIEPEFPGGAAAYQRLLNKNLRIPEDTAYDITSLSIPKMKFIVETDGHIVAPRIQGKSDTLYFNPLEKAAMQLMKKMPKWIPGRCNGKVVVTEVVRPLAICLKLEIN